MHVRPELVALLRSSRGLVAWPLLRLLLRNPLYRAHVDRVDDAHRFDVVARRHYLSAHLSIRARVAAAAGHYAEQLTRFDDDYRRAVYLADGLVLWSRETATSTYEIRLQPGNDVVHEGGLSTVLFADGGRVAVVSFSYIDGAAVGLPPTRQLLVGRIQLTHEHGYQADFNREFHHGSPARFCLAALSGIARLDDLDRVAVVRAETHPNFKPDFADGMRRAYDTACVDLGATVEGPVLHLPIPLAFPPIETVARNKRQRARARRATLEEVAYSAAAVLGAHLRRADRG